MKQKSEGEGKQVFTGKFSLGNIGSSPGTFKESYKERFIIDFHGSVESCRVVINHSAMKQTSDSSHSP